jgi:hypothetical protein
MPFTLKTLTKVADLGAWADGAAPKSLWYYSSADALTAIRVADYFLPAVNLLKLGDTLLIVSATGGTPLQAWAYVNSNTGAAIDITDGLAITATDTD